MPVLEKNWKIRHSDFDAAGDVSIQVRSLLKEMGFAAELVRRTAVCAYESEMNVVMHGGDGILFLTIEPDMIILDVKDNGPGIEDINQAMKAGFSTALPRHQEMGFGAGMGIPNIKDNADDLQIISKKGVGTHLKISFNVSSQ